MARRRSKRHTRDLDETIASEAELRPAVRAIEDRRLYNPSLVRPAKGLSFRSSEVVLNDARKSVDIRSPRIADKRVRRRVRGVRGKQLLVSGRRTSVAKRSVGSVLRFRAPQAVAVCVRRKSRREVLFAMKRGGGGKRRPRWNDYSEVRCR